jgi:hypothetical protein
MLMSYILICFPNDGHDFAKWVKYNFVYITGCRFLNTHAYCWDCYGYYYNFCNSWCINGLWNPIISTFSYPNAPIINNNYVGNRYCYYYCLTNLCLLFNCCFWFVNSMCTFSLSCLNVNCNGWNSATLIFHRTWVCQIFCSHIWSILYYCNGC